MRVTRKIYIFEFETRKLRCIFWIVEGRRKILESRCLNRHGSHNIYGKQNGAAWDTILNSSSPSLPVSWSLLKVNRIGSIDPLNRSCFNQVFSYIIRYGFYEPVLKIRLQTRTARPYHVYQLEDWEFMIILSSWLTNQC
jgi:hypothetical protein